MNKTFNVYCDESCHLENDHKNFMFIGSVSCTYPQVKRHTERINEIKKKHNFYAEIKWSHVSMSKIDFYLDILDYFFDTDLRFRTIGVRKDTIESEDFDDFYFSIYYKLLNYKIDTLNVYNVYMDIKDTLSSFKIKKLKNVLNVKYGTFRNVQNIRSEESLLIQLADFITGAISYNVNDNEKRNQAKVLILDRIKKHSHLNDLTITNDCEKLNIVFLNLN